MNCIVGVGQRGFCFCLGFFWFLFLPNKTTKNFFFFFLPLSGLLCPKISKKTTYFSPSPITKRGSCIVFCVESPKLFRKKKKKIRFFAPNEGP